MEETAHRDDETSHEDPEDAGCDDDDGDASSDKYIPSSEEDHDEAIYEAVTACLGLLASFPDQTASPDTSAKLEEDIGKYASEIPDFIQDVERSFNIWIDYTGALAADVSRSLDARLQGYEDIRGIILELLQMLARNLEYCAFESNSFSYLDWELVNS
jgi:hypothetical protein